MAEDRIDEENKIPTGPEAQEASPPLPAWEDTQDPADLPAWEETASEDISDRPSGQLGLPKWEEADEEMDSGRARALGIAEDIIPGFSAVEVTAMTRALHTIGTTDTWDMDDLGKLYVHYENEAKREVKQAQEEKPGEYYQGRALPYAVGGMPLAKAGGKAAVSAATAGPRLGIKLFNKLKGMIAGGGSKAAAKEAAKEVTKKEAKGVAKKVAEAIGKKAQAIKGSKAVAKSAKELPKGRAINPARAKSVDDLAKAVAKNKDKAKTAYRSKGDRLIKLGE